MRMKHTQVAWTERISTQLMVPALSPPRTTSQFIDLSSPQSDSRVQRVYVVPVDEPKPKEKIASSDLLIQRRCIVAGIDAAKSVMKHPALLYLSDREQRDAQQTRAYCMKF